MFVIRIEKVLRFGRHICPVEFSVCINRGRCFCILGGPTLEDSVIRVRMCEIYNDEIPVAYWRNFPREKKALREKIVFLGENTPLAEKTPLGVEKKVLWPNL